MTPAAPHASPSTASTASPETMAAVVYRRYGPPEVLVRAELPRPVPRAGEVLLRVRATTVSAGDVRMRAFDVPRGERLGARLYLGIRRPRRAVLGMEVAGEVAAVGSGVTRFAPGDRLLGSTFGAGFGGYAQYVALPARGVLAATPDTVTDAEAAALPIGGGTAVRLLRRAEVGPGDRVLVNGASGSVGSFAVQLAALAGAEVTAVCSTANVALVAGLGATEVIDYTTTELAPQFGRFDVVVDAVGTLDPRGTRRALAPGGRLASVRTEKSRERADDLQTLVDHLGAGRIHSVIDRRYPLDDLAAAHAYVGTGRKRGAVVIDVP